MKLLVGDTIAEAIREVLRDPDDDRIAAVAFVGRNPLAWIPQAQGLRLYCWPLAGATHPDGIRALVAAGADVHLVPHLHTKVYWSRRYGAVLGSANLSQSALGTGGLHEAAVKLMPGELDIDRIVAAFQAQGLGVGDPVNFAAALAQLDIDHATYQQRNGKATGGRQRNRLPTFGEWLDSPFRKKWQIDYWSDPVDENPVAPDEKDVDWIYANAANDSDERALRLAVPTLELRLNAERTALARNSKPFWWYPERTYRTDVPGFAATPYTWVCREHIPTGETVPFDPTEGAFCKALRYAVREAWDDFVNVDGYVSQAFLDALAQGYRS